MRNAFADEITKLSVEDKRVALMSGDIGNRLFDPFKEASGERFFNCGIAEANMMGMAAGMALSGYRPVVYTITPFTTTRCFEQIRVDVCYHKAPVIIVGTGSGLSYAQLGPTHHSCEDIGILRTLPGMKVFCPCDPMEMRRGLRAALKQDNPVYIRLGKKGEPDLTSHLDDFELGRASTLREGSDVCLVATGTILPVVLAAADKLAEQGLSVRVEDFHTVKPLDTERLGDITRAYPVVAVIEEHSRIGGLFSAISEWAAGCGANGVRFLSFAVEDEFMHEVGSQNYARKKFGLTDDNIATGVLKALKDH